MTNAAELYLWSQAVRLQADVESVETATAIYAIDLGALVAGDAGTPLIYRQANQFFNATHLTSGLRRLLEDVLKGLCGGTGDRVLQLRSPFGGGKSHTLAVLYHAARERAALNSLPEEAGLPDPGPVKVAVFDGEKFDVEGRMVNGRRVHTLWGLLAEQLGCYELVATHDQNLIAPGGDVIAQMLGKGAAGAGRPQPVLLLLDEVIKYLERGTAKPVADSTLGRQTQEFLQSLSTEVAGASHVVMIYSLQSSAREAFGNELLLETLDHLTSRVDAKREPVSGDEVLPVIKRRLLAEPPDPAAASAAAEAYAGEVTHMRAAYALDESGRRDAEDERLALRNRFYAAYPFHPALIDIMRERWASLPHFQRTRGALRFLSVCLRALKRSERAGFLLGPGDIPIDDPDVLQAFFTEVGQREPFKAVLERDFLGVNARIQRIDERLGRENPRLSGVKPALRLATAILMYSFGGLARPDEAGGEAIALGVTESELLSSVISPQLDSITAQTALNELREQCLYLHYDGARYAFKTTPNITQVVEEEAERISPEEVNAAIREELENRLRGRHVAIVWPADSERIPDREPRFLLAYLPLEYAMRGDAEQKEQASQYFCNHGDGPRHFRNGLGLAVPERAQVGPLRLAQRYLLALGNVARKRQALNLTSAQTGQIKERENSEKAKFEAAMRRLYQTIWLPLTIEGEVVQIDTVTLAERAMQAQGLHERLIEMLKLSPPRLFATVTPERMLDLMQLGTGENARLGVGIAEIVGAFYRVLSFPRLENEAVIRASIARGVRDGLFGYVGRAGLVNTDDLRDGGGAYVARNLVCIGVDLPEIEIEESSGVIVLPQAIQSEEELPVQPATIPGEPTAPVFHAPGPSGVAYVIEAAQPGGNQAGLRTFLRLSMYLTRQQVYASANAIGNLAQVAGRVRLVVEASKPDGFEANWLRNAVMEPLSEADIEIEE